MARYKSLDDAFYNNCPAERPPDQCWEWKGTLVGGYGMVRFRDRRYLAHRLSLELHYGPIPEDLHVCHACDNRACVNPAHLWLGTNQDNMADKSAKGRQARLVGPKQASSKLKAPQVYMIRKLAERGMTQQEIARRFGISQTNVSLIVRRKTWTFVS